MSATLGAWSAAVKTPGDSRTRGDDLGVFVIHAALLHTGNVLIFSGHLEGMHYLAESWVWNPELVRTTAVRVPFPPNTDIFCCHMVSLPDGKILTAGGSQQTTGNHSSGHAIGIKDICIYDPTNLQWNKIGDMQEGRWYPTIVPLGDGSFVAFSGLSQNSPQIARSAEIFHPPFIGNVASPYHTIPLAGGNRAFPTYPGLHMMGNGKIYHTGTNWRYEGTIPPSDVTTIKTPIQTFSLTVNPTNDTAVWVDESRPRLQPNREEGASIILPPVQSGKILVVGGGKTTSQSGAGVPLASRHVAGSNLSAAEVLNINNIAAGWQNVGPMHHPRINCSCVVLPDRNVLILGGTSSFKWDPASIPSNQCELFDAEATVAPFFTVAASLHESRTYHSAALLLPSGRVLVAGGVDPSQTEPNFVGDLITLNRKTYELYEPPYFFKGPQPTIVTVANLARNRSIQNINYGSQFVIETPNAATIQWVTLMRPGSMTHHTDPQQRSVDIVFVVGGADHLICNAPTDNNIAPSGYYMVWIIDNNRLPCSQAFFIRLHGSFGVLVPGLFSHNTINYEISIENDGFPMLMIEDHHVHIAFDENTSKWKAPHHSFQTFETLDILAKYLISTDHSFHS